MKRKRTVKLGQRIRANVHGGLSPDKLTGTVIYIHPENRFYTLEFDLGHGYLLHESYFMPQP